MKLNLPYKDVNEISHNSHINSYRKSYQILTLWREQAGQKADLNQIIKILQDMDKNNIAEKILTQLYS